MPKLTPSQIVSLRSTPIGDLPNRIRVAIDLSGLTQGAVATDTGILPSSLSELVNGRYANADAIQIGTARKLAEFFGCSIEDLFPAKASTIPAHSAALVAAAATGTDGLDPDGGSR